MSRPLVLTSGGLDSLVVLTVEHRRGNNPLALSYRYGQPHVREVTYAWRYCRLNRIEHLDRTLLLGGGGLLEGHENPVVAGRNLAFVAAAVGVAVDHGCSRILIGCSATDQDRFPDCRPGFLAQLNVLLELGYGGGIVVEAPLINSNKTEIAATARALGIALEDTWSCYYPTQLDRACGACGACIERARATA